MVSNNNVWFYIVYLYKTSKGTSWKSSQKILNNNSQKIYLHNSLIKWFSKFILFYNEANCLPTPGLVSTTLLLRWTVSHPCKCPASESQTGSQLGSSRESEAVIPSNASAGPEWYQKMLRTPSASTCWSTNVLRFCRGTSSNHGRKFDVRSWQYDVEVIFTSSVTQKSHISSSPTIPSRIIMSPPPCWCLKRQWRSWSCATQPSPPSIRPVESCSRLISGYNLLHVSPSCTS